VENLFCNPEAAAGGGVGLFLADQEAAPGDLWNYVAAPRDKNSGPRRKIVISTFWLYYF